ncbi:hypothetical protein CR513_05298, partial [Mucuna pruriens]
MIFREGTQDPNLRSNSLQEEEGDAYMEGYSHIPHEGFKEEETPTLEGPMTKGRLKKLQGEVICASSLYDLHLGHEGVPKSPSRDRNRLDQLKPSRSKRCRLQLEPTILDMIKPTPVPCGRLRMKASNANSILPTLA